MSHYVFGLWGEAIAHLRHGHYFYFVILLIINININQQIRQRKKILKNNYLAFQVQQISGIGPFELK